MKILAQDLLNEISSPEDLDTFLELSIDDALSLALSNTVDKKLSNEWYEKILDKLGETEKNAFTMGLAGESIEVTAAIKDNSKVNNLKNHFLELSKNQGCVYEDDYHELCYDITDNHVIGEINTWLVSSGISLKKNRPKVETVYKKDVKNLVKHPDIRKISQRKFPIDTQIKKGLRGQGEELTEKDVGTSFGFTTGFGRVLEHDIGKRVWLKEYGLVMENDEQRDKRKGLVKKSDKKISQRIDEEKRILEDTLRSRQEQIPNWRNILNRVRKSLDFSELRDVWDDIKNIPTFASDFNLDSKIKVVFDKCSFLTHLAKTASQKSTGLESFDSLKSDEGMLFKFDRPSHATFHMGSVKFPIDIIFLMQGPVSLKVAKIVHNIQPGAIARWSCPDTAYVLEVLGGASKENGIEIGSECVIKNRITNR